MSRFPSQRSVDRLTALNTKARVDKCDVLRQSLIENPLTGNLEPADPLALWPVVATDVQVRIETTVRSADERVQGGAVVSRSTFKARFEPGFDIRNKDRILGKTGGISGRTFQMTGPAFGSNETARIFDCEEII